MRTISRKNIMGLGGDMKINIIKTDPDLVQYFRKYNEWDLIKLLIRSFSKNKSRKENKLRGITNGNKNG